MAAVSMSDFIHLVREGFTKTQIQLLLDGKLDLPLEIRKLIIDNSEEFYQFSLALIEENNLLEDATTNSEVLLDGIEHLEKTGFLKTGGIILELRQKKSIVYRQPIPKSRAGGLSEDLPPKVEITGQDKLFLQGYDVSLKIEKDRVNNNLYIRLNGATAQIRSRINAEFFYRDSEPEKFMGIDIAGIGKWVIPARKAQSIYKICIQIEES